MTLTLHHRWTTQWTRSVSNHLSLSFLADYQTKIYLQSRSNVNCPVLIIKVNNKSSIVSGLFDLPLFQTCLHHYPSVKTFHPLPPLTLGQHIVQHPQLVLGEEEVQQLPDCYQQEQHDGEEDRR